MTSTAPQSLPLNLLVAWDGNVRKTAGADTALAELAASITAHGLLQSLVVRKGKKGKYAVVAGGRRLAALQSLANAGTIAADFPVRCHLIADDADATEISLVENTVREQMHPADEFEAFRGLIEKGTPVPDIAARFGVTPRVVEQRLKLASVSPVIIKAFREGELNLAQVMAFAASEDHAAQEKVFDNLSDYRNDPDDIRETLTDDEISARDRRVRYVTLAAYEKAGGGIRRDLFVEDDNGVFILDPVLLDDMVSKKLQKTAAKIVKEGWKWVEIRPHYDYLEWSRCERRYPEAEPLSPDLQAEYQNLEKEYYALMDADGELTDEQANRADEITDRIEQLDDREKSWQPETLAIAGVVITVDSRGQFERYDGYVKPEDKPKPVKTVAKANDDGTVTEAPAEETFSLSAILIESLTAHRSAAIGASLIDNPKVALAALAYTMTLQVYYDGYSRETCLQIVATSQSLRRVESSTASEVMERARTLWGDELPGNPDDLFAWCLEQHQDVLLNLLAFCMAHTVNAVRLKGERSDDERFQNTAELSFALQVDMTEWFKPTAENYFSKISKTGILEALKDAKGSIAPAWNTAKKSDLAVIAERELAETGWLPELLKQAA